MQLMQADILGGAVDVTPRRRPRPARPAARTTPLGLFDGSEATQFAGQAVAVDFTGTTLASEGAEVTMVATVPAAPADVCHGCGKALRGALARRRGRGRVCYRRYLTGGGIPTPRAPRRTGATCPKRTFRPARPAGAAVLPGFEPTSS